MVLEKDSCRREGTISSACDIPVPPNRAMNREIFSETESIDDVKDRRLVFSINSGRSGSQYLAELLATGKKVRCFHEPHPNMSGVHLDLVTKAPYADSKQERRVKCVGIAHRLRTMAPGKVYAETNHMFIKTFFDVILAEYRAVEVIILRRDLVKVLKSFVDMGYFSEASPVSWKWMVRADAATSALKPVAPFDEMDPCDRSIAYLLDIEARAQRFKLEYPNVPTHEVRLESLNDMKSVGEFFKKLRIAPTGATKELCGAPVNQRPQRKNNALRKISIEECQDRLRKYIARANQMGIEIPATAALEGIVV